MILNRYFLKSIFSYTLSISLIFILLIVTSRTIQYLEQASRGEINAEVVFTVVLLRLPEFLELILPLGFFLSIVLTIGRLRADSEFVIMEQAGLSALKTYYLLLIPATLISIILIYFSMVLSPGLDAKAKSLLESESIQDSFNTITPGQFHKVGGFIVFARNKDDKGLQEVFTLQKDGDAEKIIKAKTISLSENKQDLILKNGIAYSISDLEKLEVIEFTNSTIVNNHSEARAAISSAEIEKGTDSFIWSISLVMLIFISVFIALPISKINPRKGRYSRVLPALLLFSIYIGLLLSFKGEEESNTFSFSVIHIIFLLAALFLNFNSKRLA